MVAPSGFWDTGVAGEEEFSQDLMNACVAQIGTKVAIDALTDRAGMFSFSSDDHRFWRSDGAAQINLGIIEFGVDAAKPAASAANNGRVFFATDTLTLYVVDSGTQYLVSDQNVVVDHVALADAHTQYQKESEKNAANGYAGLDAGALVLQSDLPDHASRHPRGGADEIDGDVIDIDFTPTVYVPDTAPAEVTDVNELTAHLKGIDNLLADVVAQKVVFKTAIETLTTDIVLQNDDHLFLAIAADEDWAYTFNLQMNSPTAADFKLRITVPSGASGIVDVLAWSLTKLEDANVGGAVGDTVILLSTVIMRFILVKVTVENGATPGNVQLQWAQNSSSGSTSVHQGSSMIGHKLN